MTDFNENQPKRSFKEQILAELEEANRLRKQREEELLQKELEAKAAAEETARLMAEFERQKEVEAQEAARQEEERLLREAQERETARLLAEAQLKAQQEEAARQQAEEAARLEAERQEELEALETARILEEIKAKSQQEEVAEQEVTLSPEPDFTASEEPIVSDFSLEQAAEVSLENPVFEEVDLASPETGETDLETTQVFLKEDLAGPTVAPLDFETLDEPLAEQDVENEEEEVLMDSRQRRQERTDSLARRISAILISIIVLALLGLGIFGTMYVSSALGPIDKNSTDYVQVEIPSGSGNKLIGQILEESGLIKSGTIFNYYTKFRNYTNFQSGYYNLQKNMSLDTIAQELQKGGTAEPVKPALGKVLVTEGLTIAQIATAVTNNVNTEDTTDKTPFSSEEFLALVKDEAFIAEMAAKYPTLLGSLPSADQAIYRLEGYLFPATYNYYAETTLRQLVEEMIATMDTNLATYYNQIAASGMTVNEVLTLASLVEKEGSTDDDRKMIASVFYNRLNQGMPLQSNIAILYAMGKLGEKTTLAEDAGIDTSIASPYNIYQNPGLMPGPVDSPSLSAIVATVSPASTDYLYFVADVTTGAVYYAATYEEHSANVEQYVNSQLSN